MLTRLRSLFRALVARDRFEDGMADELRFHIEEYTQDLMRDGVPPLEAARRARLEFGRLDNVKDDCRQARGLRFFDTIERDLRYAVRLLRKTPGFTLTALATLALCLGANLTVFAIVDSVLLRALPFPQPDRLVSIYNSYPKAGVPNDGVSLTNYYERRNGQIAVFSHVAIYKEGPAVIGETGATEQEFVTRVSPEFFATLGVSPSLGRAFTEEETTYRSNHVVILTDTYWRQHFNADTHVIGRSLRADGEAFVIVGVLPPTFRFLSSTSRVYFPLASSPEQRLPQRRHWGDQAEMIARLAPGVTLTEAQAQVDAHNSALERSNPDARRMADAGFRSLVVSLHGSHVAAVRPTLLLMQAGVLFLLLIGVVNLVNLLLIRASARMRELGIRQAMGATRGDVISSVLMETMVLTAIGGAFGLGVGASGIRLVLALGADRLPLGTQIAFDARLALVALAATIALGLAIAIPIAWYNLHVRVASALHLESRSGTTSRATQRLRHGFVVAQIALAFVVLAGAGLLGLSLSRVMSVSPGFRPDHVSSGRISPPWSRYRNDKVRLELIDRVLDAIEREPGVIASGAISNVPLSGNTIKSAATVRGYRPPPGAPPRGHYSYSVSGDYFDAAGIPLREGRFFTREDAHRPERICIVDEEFARRYWPGTSAVGQRIFMGSQEESDDKAFTVVGVVGAVKQAGLADEQEQGAVYYTFRYRGADDMFFVTRTALPPDGFASTLQRIVRESDPELPMADIRSMETRVADSLMIRRSPAVLAALFAAVALLLTAIGTYGVLSYAVAERRREISLRVALGARPDQVRAQFVMLGLRLLAAGSAFGVTGAWLTGRAMQTILFRVPPLPSAILAGTAAIMVIVSLAACLIPSYRAARVSPLEALNAQ